MTILFRSNFIFISNHVKHFFANSYISAISEILIIFVKVIGKIYTLPFAIVLLSDAAVSSQDLGSNETFGQNGRIFSRGESDFYLLSRQPAGTDDSAGFVGQVRIVKHYSGGGYEEAIYNYSVRCKSTSRQIDVLLFKQEEEPDAANLQRIEKPDKRPAVDKKPIYNLYWAACSNQFQKFK